MKHFWIAGLLCACTASAFAAEATTTYERETVIERERTRDWMAYDACEVEFSIFGTGTVGEDTLEDPSSKKIDRDGELGMGLGLAFFFTRYLGIEGYAYTESTDEHFVDNVGANLIGRFPLGRSGVAPYVFAGGGRQFDPVIQWTWDAGGGIQWRFIDHAALFVDARYVWADDTEDYGLGRLGIKFGF